MKFYGLKKVTLIDFPGTIACTVFTHGCTLRCPFCHNPELVIDKPDESSSISDSELLEFLNRRVNKLDGVVFTGGEPLLNSGELIPILHNIKKLGLKIKIDTNGTLHAALSDIIDQKLADYIAMDLKTAFDEYAKMYATDEHVDSVKKSLELLRTSDVPYEIRTTVVPGLHSTETIAAMGPTIRTAQRYILQNFAPNGTVDPSFKKIKPFPIKEMTQLLETAKKFNSRATIRDQQG